MASKDEMFALQDGLFREYARNFKELCRSNGRLAEMKEELRQSVLCPGLSSPPILTPEQAAYKNGTKVYIGDRNITLIMWRDRMERLIFAEEKEAARLRTECLVTMQLIVDAGLDGLQTELLAGRYFDHESIRSLAVINQISKSTAYRGVLCALAQIYGDHGNLGQNH